MGDGYIPQLPTGTSRVMMFARAVWFRLFGGEFPFGDTPTVRVEYVASKYFFHAQFSQRTLPANSAQIKTDNYTATVADSGLLFSFNAPAVKTLTLPAQPPPLGWNIFVENIAADLITIDPNTNPTTGTSNLIDKTAGVIKLSLGQSIAIYSAYQLDNSGNPDPTVPLTYVTFGRPADIANFKTKIANGTGGSKLNGILVGGCIDTQGTFRRLEVVQLTTCEDRGDGTLENYTRLFYCSERFKLPGQ